MISIRARADITYPYGAGVLTRLFMATGRYRRPILALGSAAAAAYLLAHIWTPTLTDRTLPAMATASVALFVLSLVGLAGARPRSLKIRPQDHAFTTLPGAAEIYLVLGQMVMTTAYTGLLLRGLAAGEPLISSWLTPLFPALLVFGLVTTWRDTGIELRPDGLRDRAAFGSFMVPWEALPVVPLPAPGDRRSTLRMECARPELIRRHGLVVGRKLLSTRNVDPRMVAQVIRYYSTHPEHRPAIGTRGEYERLLAELDRTPPSDGFR